MTPSNTVTFRKTPPGSPVESPLGISDWIMGLLARMVPDTSPGDPIAPEASYMKRFAPSSPGQPVRARGWEEILLRLAGDPDTPWSRVALVLCGLVETDPMAGRCVAYLQHPMEGSRPTLSLLAAVVLETGLMENETPGSVMTRIASGEAARTGLLQILNDTLPLPERPVRLHGPVVLNLTDRTFSWPGTEMAPGIPDTPLPPSIALLAERQARAMDTGRAQTLVVRSPSSGEKKRVAGHIARTLNRTALFIHDRDKAMTALGPICTLRGLLPVLTIDGGPGETMKLPSLPGYEGPTLVLAGTEGTVESDRSAVTGWTVPCPTREEREVLWNEGLADPDLARRLAEDHVHGMDRILELSALAGRQGTLRGKARPGLEEIREASWMRESRGLNALAQPVRADVTAEALIVRPLTRTRLDLLEQRCRLRERLSDNLGVTLRTRYRMGVKALFTGPSGTGKTLAASHIATRLGMPLYRVDLASVTSKFIGETEKNLSRLLGEAEQEDVVLLFDEADSLFGKRTDVKDANDRFANAQTNYLLQRIESYTGVVILTSNSKARFDAAFTRRLDMMIDFPLPGPEERRGIWLSHLGSFHTLSRSNLNQLSLQCDFSGGHIRNAVLTAAVIAKTGGRTITMADMTTALTEEYHKLGRQIPPDLKRHGQDVPEE